MHLEDHFLDPAEVRLARIEDFGLPALELGVLHVHAHQVGRPQVGFLPAFGALNLEDDVALRRSGRAARRNSCRLATTSSTCGSTSSISSCASARMSSSAPSFSISSASFTGRAAPGTARSCSTTVASSTCSRPSSAARRASPNVADRRVRWTARPPAERASSSRFSGVTQSCHGLLSTCDQRRAERRAAARPVAQVLDRHRVVADSSSPRISRVARAAAIAALSCLPSLRSPNARSAREPRRPQRLGQAERPPLAALVADTQKRARSVVRRGGDVLVLQLQDDAFDAAREARRQASVARRAARPGHRSGPRRRERFARPPPAATLPHRAGVVVQPAHQPRIDRERDGRAFDVPEPRLEVRPAVVAQVVGAVRRAVQHRLTLRLLLVEQAQRIGLEAAPAILAQTDRGHGSSPPAPGMYPGGTRDRRCCSPADSARSAQAPGTAAIADPPARRPVSASASPSASKSI